MKNAQNMENQSWNLGNQRKRAMKKELNKKILEKLECILSTKMDSKEKKERVPKKMHMEKNLPTRENMEKKMDVEKKKVSLNRKKKENPEKFYHKR